MLIEQEQKEDYSKFIILKKAKLFDFDYNKYNSVVLPQSHYFVNSNLIIRNYQKFYYYFIE